MEDISVNVGLSDSQQGATHSRKPTDRNLSLGLHISPKDRKHMFTNMFLSLPDMPWSPSLCNNHKYRSSTRNT